MNTFELQSLRVTCSGEALLLHPERALFWPARRTLFVADVHVGKEHTFGRTGIAIPGGISEHTLQRLFRLCDAAQAERIVVLGDFMHTTPLASEGWLGVLHQLLRQRPKLSMSIVAGNHDTMPGQSIVDERIRWHSDSVLQPPFVLQHVPGDDPRGFVLSGHIHPVWRISCGRRARLRASVFWFRKGHAVLPAFGNFTGGYSIKPDARHDSLYMTGPDCVIEVPAARKRQ